MQVSRIEIFGFKSFMERLILPLDVGVTGVVGPNGCGKSNIVDAIRWVLGETRAKSLRGGLLEDVIFNGTDALRPLGLAEVTLTLRSKEEDFFADLTSQALEAEAIVSAAETEVVIENENQAQLEEDQIEVEAEEGPHLRVIEGNLDAEESPSMSLADKLESTPNVEASTTLVNRFSWLKAATEVQVTRRLYRSGESEFFINRVPCRLKDIKELFRAVGLGARAHTIVAQGEVSRVVTAKSEDRRRILEEAAGVQGFREKINGAERRLTETAQNMARIEDILKEVSRQVNSLKRQAARARNRQQLKDTLRGAELKLYRNSFIKANVALKEQEQRMANVRDEESQVETKLKLQIAEEQEARGELLQADVAADDVRSKIDAIKEELSNRVRQRVQRQERLAELKAFAIAKEAEIKRLEQQESQLKQRQASAQANINELLSEEKQLSLQLGEQDQALSQRIQELESERQNLQAVLKEKEQELQANREALISAESRLKSLKDQLIAASPLKTLEQLQNQSSTLPIFDKLKSARMLIEGIEVPEQYLRAIQAVLAEKAAFLVVDNPHATGVELLDVLKNLAEDQRSFGVGVLNAQYNEHSSTSIASQFTELSSLVRAQEYCKHVVASLLKNVFLAESLDQAVAYFRANPDSVVTLVTTDGDVVTKDSLYCFRHDAGLVTITNEVKELEKTCSDYQASQQILEREVRDLQIDNTHLEERLIQTRKAHAEGQAQRQQLGSKLGALQGRREVEQQVIEQQVQDNLQLNEQLREIQVMLASDRDEQSRVQEELGRMQSDDEEALHAEVKQLQENYVTLDQTRKEGRELLSNLARVVEQTRNTRDAVRSRISEVELACEKLKLELEHTKERVVSDYGEEVLPEVCFEAEAELLSEQELEDFQEEVQKIKRRILREGDVDPTSIERLEEENTRLEDLKQQRQDLVKAEATLKQTIARLRDTSEKRFLSTFEAVRENFSQLVPRLFGGGRGSLELSDPSQPLDTGLEIVVRPPGKKLKSIELLSGGEKALCATALIFAMFLERPSPMCVLDEVDAPLDDANLMRFITLVKEMSAKTQFIMITHNKQSMAAADTLVGVTMEQPGASKVLSVSLQEAYQQVA